MLNKRIAAWTTFLFFIIYRMLTNIKNYLSSVILALKLPGPPALPVLGNILVIKNPKDMVEIAYNAANIWTPMFRIWLFFVPTIWVYEPEHLKIIMSNTRISEKNLFYQVMHRVIGDGLITSTGEKWRRNRRYIQPYFQVNILESYFERFAEVSEDIVQCLSEKRSVKMTEIVNTYLSNLLHKTVLGIALSSKDETPFKRSELLLIKRMLKPWLLLDSVFQFSEAGRNEEIQKTELHKYIKKILDERRKQRKTGKIASTCLMDVFIELSETTDFSEEDILNECVTFMLAGQDSVGSALAFSLYYLAKHQDVQEKVFKEINEIIYEDHLKTIKIEQINQMHYLEQCIKETLRLAPSVPILGRVITTDVTLGNITIPSGTNIFISPFITHRLPHIFPEPLQFDPDRFSQENLKKLHPYSFIPFSAGPRNCIGYKFAYIEIKTIVSAIIKNYHIALRPGYEELCLAYGVSLRMKKGLWLEITPRNKKYVD